MSNKLEIFLNNLEKHKNEYCVIHDCLDSNDYAEIKSLVDTFEPDQVETITHEDDLTVGSAVTKSVEQSDFRKDSLFYQLLDRTVLDRLGKIYGIKVDAYSLTVVRDDSDFYNGMHNDVKDDKSVVTLQWYIQLDDLERDLRYSDRTDDLNPTRTHVRNNSFFGFKSTPTTHHMYNPGWGERKVVRLRLYERLYNKQIHDLNTSDELCVYIDAKPMGVDVEVFGNNFEKRLGVMTYYNLLEYGFNNFVLNEYPSKFNDHIVKLKHQGFTKCLVIFAGAVVGPEFRKTIDELVFSDNLAFANKFEDRIARQYVVLDLTRVSQKLDNQGNTYLQSIMDSTVHIETNEVGISYVHPEEYNARELLMLANNQLMKIRSIEYDEPEHEDTDTLADMEEKLFLQRYGYKLYD